MQQCLLINSRISSVKPMMLINAAWRTAQRHAPSGSNGHGFRWDFCHAAPNKRHRDYTPRALPFLVGQGSVRGRRGLGVEQNLHTALSQLSSPPLHSLNRYLPAVERERGTRLWSWRAILAHALKHHQLRRIERVSSRRRIMEIHHAGLQQKQSRTLLSICCGLPAIETYMLVLGVGQGRFFFPYTPHMQAPGAVASEKADGAGGMASLQFAICSVNAAAHRTIEGARGGHLPDPLNSRRHPPHLFRSGAPPTPNPTKASEAQSQGEASACWRYVFWGVITRGTSSFARRAVWNFRQGAWKPQQSGVGVGAQPRGFSCYEHTRPWYEAKRHLLHGQEVAQTVDGAETEPPAQRSGRQLEHWHRRLVTLFTPDVLARGF